MKYIHMSFHSEQEHCGERSVWRGGEHDLPGVPGQVSSCVSEVAPAEGKQRQEERGEQSCHCKAVTVAPLPL